MSTSSALMKLIGNEVVGGGRKSVLSELTNASTKMAEKEGANIARKLAVDEISEKTPSVLRVFTKDNPMSLQEAYERTASMRNAHASNKRMLTDASGKELYRNLPYDFMKLGSSNPYAKKLFGDYDNAISREIGSENASKLRNILGDYARLDNEDFEGSRNMVKNFLNSKDSDAVVNKSRDLLEDAGVYRAQNSPDGISWTTKPSVALQYVDESLHPDGTKILEGEIHPNNRVIAPQFTERYQPALAQHEVIGDPSGIQQVGKTKMVELLKGEGVNTHDINVANALRYMKPKNGGNYGHKGVKGMRGGSAPKSQQPVDDRVTLYRGLEQEYDPNYPVARLDTSGYESWTDNPELAEQYGDYVYSIDVPKSDIKNSYLDENPNSPTYGDRNPIYMIDKKAGLNGASGNEYLLEVGSDYQKGLTYNKAQPPKEVQLDDDTAKALDKAMGYAKQKMNIPVKMAGEYPDDFSRIPVRFTDKEIDTLHKYTGKIPELYHQTTASSLGNMTLDRRQAVSGDSGMPEGIFLKENDEDIGLLGKHQLALNAKMENPAYFKDRADLDNFMRSRGAKDLMSMRNELDDYYQKLADEAEKKQHDLAMIAWDNPTPENKALAEQAMNDWQKITEEWTRAIDENGEKAREGIRNTLVNNGYDSAIIENDAGSGGRSVKSYIVFDKNQLSPRYKEGMSFDPNDAQSVFNEASKRQKSLDDVMSKIADKITSAGDKAVYKSGGNKSIESMTNKVNRKMSGGRDYRLMDMKDHMRGAVFLQDLNNEANEITNLLEEMQYAFGQAPDIEAVDTDLGYTGLHLTWRDDDGLGYEIQVTTPEIWDTKKASDKIYDEIRNWTESELKADPKKQSVFDAKVAESRKLWSDLWDKLGGKPDLKTIESFNDDMYF